MEARRRGVVLIRMIGAIGLALAVLVAPMPAMVIAAPTGFTVTQNQATSNFPKTVSFHLVAQNLAEMISLRLAYRIGDDPVTYISAVAFTPGLRLDVSHQIDLTQHYVPPGVTLHYQWQLVDQTGAQLQSDWADVAIVDPRFAWHEQTLGSVTLHWYNGDAQFAHAVLVTAASALGSASSVQTASGAPVVQVFLYANESDFQSTLGGSTDQWVGGVTMPIYRVVLLLAPGTNLVAAQRSIAHEMTHLVLDQNDNPFGPLPSWLDEGISMVAEGEPDPTFVQALQTAAQAHHLLSIQSISGNFPEATDQATLAYAESDSLIRYFVQTYGSTKLNLLIAAFRQGQSSDDAFKQVIGESTLQFQQAWEQSLTPATATASPVARGSTVSHLLNAPVDLLTAAIQSILQLVHATKGQPA